MGKLLLGKEKGESGDAGSTLALVRQNTVEVLYIYEEAMKKPIISTKCLKLLEFRTSRISSAGFSAAIQ